MLRGIELAEAEIIIRGVHKPGLKRRYPKPYHPHDIALADCAAFIAARIRKIEAGIVPGDRSSQAVERL